MTNPAPYIDHTLLQPDVTGAAIARLCEEAVEYGFASVCVPPRFVADAARRLYGSESLVCTVVGFPLGYEPTAVKVFQARTAVGAGAQELDMVIQLGAARNGDYADVAADIRAVIEAVPGIPVKVILETCLFETAVQCVLVEAAVAAGAAFVKTSSGFAARGATLDDVQTLVAAAAGRIRVKASGGIRNHVSCQDFLAAGAERIGTSAGVAIVQQWRRDARLP